MAIMLRFWEKTFIFLAVVMFIGTGLLTPKFASGPEIDTVEPVLAAEEIKLEEPIRVVAVGDIMLGRNVENLSRENGWDYPFSRTSDIFGDADYVLANFEGTIPENHIQTPYMGFRFSFVKDAVDALADAGVNVVSLANNHAHDFGAENFVRTREELLMRGVVPFGHPTDENINHTRTIVEEDISLHFVGLNDTFLTLDTEKAEELVDVLKNKNNDFVFVSIHWGDEYKLESNDRQRNIARKLIDAGADAIIGHHPHVVQEVEFYKEKPIFYSLGNFIFDQYFSDETQEGLAVEMEITREKISYNLVPVSIERSVPARMEKEEAVSWLSDLMDRSRGFAFASKELSSR